ncbi:MAG TPA: helix-turn-helix transcriptional regulator [Pseudonocardiaceae bacterium]
MCVSHDAGLGRRIRERRVARGLSLRVVAELAGLSEGHLSRIERGLRPVDRRSTLEAIAAALQVAPTDLTDGWHIATSRPDAAAYSALVALRAALADSSLGDPAVDTARPWPALAAALARLNEQLRPAHDYAGFGALLPGLIAELHVVAGTAGEHRAAALWGLLDCYAAAALSTKSLGDPSAAQVAAMHARDVAGVLGHPVASARAASLLAQAVTSPTRERTLTVARRAAAELAATDLGAPGAAEMCGMLHLTSSLAAAALRRPAESAEHLGAAAELAERVGDVSPYNNTFFGTANLTFWRMALAAEAGEGGKVVELARTVDPQRIPSPGRQAAYWSDLGRGLAMDRNRRPQAVVALRRAEELDPLTVRASPYVRSTVVDLVRRARRDAAGADLRGMAYRMGIAV